MRIVKPLVLASSVTLPFYAYDNFSHVTYMFRVGTGGLFQGSQGCLKVLH